MGKSLSILSLIVETLEAGQRWADERRSSSYEVSQLKGHTRATLIVVSSARKAALLLVPAFYRGADRYLVLINNWCKEITE